MEAKNIAVTLQEAGPLLTRLVAAQQFEERAVSYPAIEQIADSLIARAKELGDCMIWPIGAAAERIAGVATAREQGRIEVGCWNTLVVGRRLLVFSVVAVSPLSLAAAAGQLRRRGAAEIHGCGVDITGASEADCFESFACLNGGTADKPRVGAAAERGAMATVIRIRRSA